MDLIIWLVGVIIRSVASIVILPVLEVLTWLLTHRS